MTTSSAALSRDRDRDAVLVVFAVTDETQICMLDPQARLRPDGLSAVTLPRHGDAAGRGALYHRATQPRKTAFALILRRLETMIRSMTGFARRERQGPWGTLVCELRTVNHRYLETSLRLPDELKALDNEVRQVDRRSAAPRQGRRQPVPEVRQRVRSARSSWTTRCSMSCSRASSRCARSLPDAAPVSPLELLRWPGVVREAEVDVEAGAGRGAANCCARRWPS